MPSLFALSGAGALGCGSGTSAGVLPPAGDDAADATRNVQSFRLPSNANVVILAATLVGSGS